MALHNNNRMLIAALMAAPMVDGRFEQLQLVNVDPTTGAKRGCFSIVFKAFDTVGQKWVALKFYDQDPVFATDTYRRAAFSREHTILQTLLNTERCLQLASAMSTYQLQIADPSSKQPFIHGCPYFAVDWMEKDVDDYFLRQQHFDAEEKLLIFKEIVLAVQALHNRGVFHRDLKYDNLRSYQRNGKERVVAIDLGTAARIDSGPIQASYGHPVGARFYAAPEAVVGLAGNRRLAPMADVYALGCLLYELFNVDYYYVAFDRRNGTFGLRLAAMGPIGKPGQSDEAQIGDWKAALWKLAPGVSSASIDDAGTSCPSGIATLLDELLSRLTNVDYSLRPTFDWILARLSSAVKTLQHERLYQRALAERRRRRENRERKVERSRARIRGSSLMEVTSANR